MGFRGCRIAVSGVAVFLLFVAFALTLAAIFTPQWQVAGLGQVNQLRFLGLYQTCAYGSRQGPMSPPQWICTFIPYGRQNQFMFGPAAGGGLQSPLLTGHGTENDHTAFGGECKSFFNQKLFDAHFQNFFAAIQENFKPRYSDFNKIFTLSLTDAGKNAGNFSF